LANLNDLVPLVLDRIEEDRNDPQFWVVDKEIRVFLVEAMNEAALITGEPQIRFDRDLSQTNFTTLTLAANQTVFDFSTNIPLFGMMRMESAGTIFKTTMWDLDRIIPGWQNETGDVPKYWFPIGIAQFGIYPQLNAVVSVIVSGIAEPVPSARPFTGLENVDFQDEYKEAYVDYAAHICALKEGTKEFVDSIRVMDRFLRRMQELSKFGTRKGSLRFTRTMGYPARVAPVEQR
jgi:hypothetical protein